MLERKRGTVDSIFILHNVINTFMEKGNNLYTCFIDFSKAFDNVVHDNPWYKLLKIGIRGKIFNILENIKTRLFCDGVKSKPFYCQLGVRQGECLSPFLFAMYINYLYLSASNSGITASHMKMFLLLYDDDIAIFVDSAEELQSEINTLYAYSDRWKLLILPNHMLLFLKMVEWILRKDLCMLWWNYCCDKKPIPRSVICIVWVIPPSSGHFVRSS